MYLCKLNTLIMEDITQQNCPKGGKHKLSYLKNVYSVA